MSQSSVAFASSKQPPPFVMKIKGTFLATFGLACVSTKYSSTGPALGIGVPPRTRTPSMSKAMANGTTGGVEEDRERRLLRTRVLRLLEKDEEDRVVLGLAAAAAVDRRRSSMVGEGVQVQHRWAGLSTCAMEHWVWKKMVSMWLLRRLRSPSRRLPPGPRSWLGGVAPSQSIPAVLELSSGA